MGPLHCSIITLGWQTGIHRLSRSSLDVQFRKLKQIPQRTRHTTMTTTQLISRRRLLVMAPLGQNVNAPGWHLNAIIDLGSFMGTI